MKKTNLIKMLVVISISLMEILFSSNVLAATDEDGYEDLTEALGNSTSNNSSNTGNNSTNTNNSANNKTANTNTNRSNNTNNSSIYNNTNLPKTGISDSIPVALLLVVFGVSSVYAYKKIRDYKNI